MNSELTAIRDAEFFRAFAKDKKINRAEFNRAWNKKNREKPAPTDFFATAAPSAENAKNYEVLKTYCEKFPNISKRNIILCGAAGTGKTFAANLVAKSIGQKYSAQFSTAFGMVTDFQKYINSFGRDTELLEKYLDADLLVIDDLGAEPIIKNITAEHIYNILNERLSNGRAFIITTNLSPASLAARYDERIASRILSRETGTVLEMKGKDGRLNSPKKETK